MLTGTQRRGAPWTPVTLGPLALSDGELELRSPRLSDGPAWSAARLANRDWLEPAFPAWGRDWEAEQSEVAWAQRWRRVRWQAICGRSKPFVMTLDGVLMGECGVDAVDAVSGAGEASNWKVRSHGSPAVVNAASLLLLDHAFTDPNPIARMVGPVATTSRRGRGPGLSAIGFEIEATVPRRVGTKGLVDHDIWVLHNTVESRHAITEALRPLRDAAPLGGRRGSAGQAPSTWRSRGALTGVAGRAAVREVRAGVRRAAATVASRGSIAAPARTVASADQTMTMRPASRREVVAVGGSRRVPSDATSWAAGTTSGGLVVVGHRTDPGTATTEVFAATRRGTSRALLDDQLRSALRAVLGAVLDDVRPAGTEQRLAVLRVPSGADRGAVPDAALLTELGLDRIATYRGDTGPHGWGGEDVWRVPAAS